MKIAVIIEARMTSTRLPGKVLRPVNGKPLLDIMIDRLSQMRFCDEIVVATTTNADDDPIIELAQKRGVCFYRGSEEDVLDRVLQAALSHQVDVIVETTADCPVIDPEISDQVVSMLLKGRTDFASNCVPISYPRGMDTKAFSTKILKEVSNLTNDPTDREHVSYYIYNHPERYQLATLSAPAFLTRPDLRLTVDTLEDFRLIEQILLNLGTEKPQFSLHEILNFLDQHPWLYDLNRHIEQKSVSY